MSNVAVALITLLAGLALIHVYWGFGGRWPGHDETSMVERVVGRTNNMRAPSLPAALAVAGALLTAALLVGLYERQMLSGIAATLVTAGFWGASLVFLLRGVAGYVPAVFRYAEGTPFHRLNRTLYSPICLAVFSGFIATAR